MAFSSMKSRKIAKKSPRYSIRRLNVFPCCSAVSLWKLRCCGSDASGLQTVADGIEQAVTEVLVRLDIVAFAPFVP